MRRLYRSNHDRMITGVAGGMAEYFKVDPTLIRLAWVISIFTSVGIVAYFIAAIIIPPDPKTGWTGRSSDSDGNAQTSTESTRGAASPDGGGGSAAGGAAELGGAAGTEATWRHESDAGRASDESRGCRSFDGSSLFGWLLVGFGVFLLAERFVPWWAWHRFWPLILIAMGVYLLLDRKRKG